MKTLTLVLLAGLLATGGLAQMPKIQRAEIKTPGVSCEKCKATIERIAPQYLDGLVKINVMFKQKKTLVQWYPDRTNLEEIRTAIANAGYDADDVAANPDSYKKLEDCCKKPEDRKTPPPPPKKKG
jgi:periplasmic mercuric ion binding protein